MKTISINVSEPVYREYQERARQLDRPTAELIREAMEAYRERWRGQPTSLRELAPLSLGKVKRPLEVGDLLSEMIDAGRR
jgi:hypothetical protein